MCKVYQREENLALWNHTQTPRGAIKDVQSALLYERGRWHFSLWSIMWHIRAVLKAEFSDNNRAAAVSISLDSAEIRVCSEPMLSSHQALVEKPLPVAVRDDLTSHNSPVKTRACTHKAYELLQSYSLQNEFSLISAAFTNRAWILPNKCPVGS